MADIDLYILRSCNEVLDTENLESSFGSVSANVIKVTTIRDIPDKTESKWYAVMYDSEIFDERLKEALPVVLKDDNLMFISFYKKNSLGECFLMPRIFKNGVVLQKNSLMPVEKGLEHTTILDGWILDVSD